MSTTLSMISRQWALSTGMTFQVQSVYLSVPTPSSSGGSASMSASEPSGSCQIISIPLRTTLS